jgi:hypothetical protein
MKNKIATENEALRKAQGGEHERYLGVLRPPVGVAQWDPDELVFAVRLTIDDEEFPCGAECCGYQSYAVVAVRLGSLAAHN